MIWKIKPEVSMLNESSKNTLTQHLGIEFTSITEDSLVATMPVDHRTHQPMGLLHGGASAALSETLGSVASLLVIGIDANKAPVGLEINANHLKSVKNGKVTGICKPIKLGRSIHVWNTEIFNEAGDLICTSRLTTFIKEI